MLKKYWPLLIIFLWGLTPLIWYRDGLPIAGGDNYYLLNPRQLFDNFRHTWLGRLNFGAPSLQIPLLFPLTFFWFFFGLFDLTSLTIEKLWSILIFTLPGLSLYTLFLYVFPTEDEDRRSGLIRQLSALAAAALYTFNPWVMVDAVTPVSRLIAGFAPFFLLFWIKGLSQDRLTLRYSLLIGLTSLFLASTFAQPVAAVYIPLSLGLYLLLFLFWTRRFSHGLKFLLLTFFFFLVFNFWWLCPYVLSMQHLYASFEQAARSYNFLWATPVFDSFRFMGFWAFRGLWNHRLPHIPYSPGYYEPLFVALSYALIIIALSVLLRRCRHKLVVFFSLLGLTGVFLSKGANPPLGGIYRILYEHLPGFSAFREPYARFTGMQVLSFSLLFGSGLASLAGLPHRFRRLTTVALPVFFILIVLLLGYPLITGRVIQSADWHGQPRESLYVEVPSYWGDLADWLKSNDPQGRVLALPRFPYVHCFRWRMGFCSSGPIAPLFLANPLFIFPEAVAYYGDEILQNLYSRLRPGKDYSLAPLFEFFGIDYVLSQNDIDWKLSPSVIQDPQVTRDVLSRQEDLQLKKSFGELDLYEVSARRPPREVFLADRLLYVDGSPTTLLDKILLEKDRETTNVYLFTQQDNPPPSIVSSRLTPSFIDGKLIKVGAGRAKFSLRAPQVGDYGIYLKEESRFFLPGKLKYLLNGESSSISEKEVPGTPWFTLGALSLSEGENFLEIIYPPSGDLISAEGVFNGVAAPPEIEAPPRGTSKETWILPLTPDSPTSFVPLKKVVPGGLYKISFWYKNVKKFAPRFGVSEINCELTLNKSDFGQDIAGKTGCENTSIFADLKESYGRWRFTEKTFPLRPTTKTAFLIFELGEPGTVVYLNSLKMEQLLDVSLTAAAEPVEGRSVEAPSKIIYRKVNPAKYLVSFEDGSAAPQGIFLAGGFSRDWKVYPVPKSWSSFHYPLETLFLKPLPEANHFAANGFMNGWHWQGEEKELVIEFRPQRYYSLGLLILAAGLLFITVYFARSFIRDVIKR